MTVTEMNRYLKKLGMEISEEELKYLVIPLCESEDGSLTFDGFVGLCHSVFGERSEGEFSNGEIGSRNYDYPHNHKMLYIILHVLPISFTHIYLEFCYFVYDLVFIRFYIQIL